MNGRFLIALVISTIVSPEVYSQTVSRMAPPLEHEKRFFVGENGDFFIARSMPLFLFISSTPDASSRPHLLESKASAEHTNPMFLAEGLNYLKNPKAIDPKTKDILADVEINYEIYGDGTAPETKGILSAAPQYVGGDTVYYGRGLKFTLSSNDQLSGVQATYLSENGFEFKPFAEPVTDFSKGPHYSLRYYSVDNVGNAENLVEDLFTVDLSPPETAFEVNGIHDWNVLSSKATISLSSEDHLSGVKTIFFQIDDAEKQNYAREIRVGTLSEGEHTLSFSAEDNVGNIETAHSYSFYHDNSPPEIAVSIIGEKYESPNTVYVGGNSRVQMEAADNIAGVESIKYKIDNKDENIYSSAFYLPTKSGLHEIAHYLVDKVDNRSREQIEKFYVDLTPPETQFNFSGSIFKDFDTFIINKDTELSFSSVDMEAGLREIKFKINAREYSRFEKPLSFEHDGKYELEYFSIDNVSNIEERKKMSILVESSQAKTVALASPLATKKRWNYEEGYLVGSIQLPFFLRIAASPEDTATSFLLDLGTATTQDSLPIYFDKEGENLVSLGFFSNRGVFQVDVDGTPPITQAVFSNAEQFVQGESVYFGPELILELIGEDNKTGIRSGFSETLFSIDGLEFLPYQEPLKRFFAEKEYSCDFYSIDKTGNIEDLNSVKFIVDLTPPQTKHTVRGPFYGNHLSPEVSISLEATDNLSRVKSLFFHFDDNQQQLYSGTLTSADFRDLADGEHILYYFAVDNVGNIENKNAFTFDFDRSPPRVALKIVGDEHRQDETVFVSSRSRFELSAADAKLEVKSIHFQTDSSDVSTYTSRFGLPETGGPHSISYYCLDLVDNASSRLTKTVFLDLTPPTTEHSIAGPTLTEGNQWFISSATAISLQSTDRESGIKTIRYRINQDEVVNYSGPFVIDDYGMHSFEFRAIDNVDNREAQNKITFFVDNEPPKINISYSVELKDDPQKGIKIIPKNGLMYIAAEDADTGVDKITYSINAGKEKLYRKPLSKFKKGQVTTIEVTVTDLLNNTREEKISLMGE